MTRGISVHLGLNKVDPAHYDGWDGALNACEFDAHDMLALAESRGFEPTVILTKEATADAVVAVINKAADDYTRVGAENTDFEAQDPFTIN